jgi:C4-dicarboxylate-specific signal transduction histidine kinase
LLIRRDFAGSRRAESALREAKDQLEARVRERTAELEQSNVLARESEARLRTATDTARVGLVILDEKASLSVCQPNLLRNSESAG